MNNFVQQPVIPQSFEPMICTQVSSLPPQPMSMPMAQPVHHQKSLEEEFAFSTLVELDRAQDRE
jgi:hypothetical protein